MMEVTARINIDSPTGRKLVREIEKHKKRAWAKSTKGDVSASWRMRVPYVRSDIHLFTNNIYV